MPNLNISNPNYFDKNFSTQQSYIDKQPVRIDSIDTFIKSTNDLEEQRLKGNKLANLTSSTTAGIVSFCTMLIGLGTIIFRFKKTPLASLDKVQKNALINKNIKTYLATTLAALAGYIGIQAIHNKKINNESSELVEQFKKYNTDTSAKLSNKHLRSKSLGAQYNIINGKVEVNRNYLPRFTIFRRSYRWSYRNNSKRWYDCSAGRWLGC